MSNNSVTESRCKDIHICEHLQIFVRFLVYFKKQSVRRYVY